MLTTYQANFALAVAALVSSATSTWAVEHFAANAPVQFNRDIRPILTRHCTSCHGGVKAIADVSFVSGDSVLPPDGWVIEPGDADASMLIERIISDDPDTRMPPPHEHPDPVPPADVEVLRRWINEGAVWDPIWSVGPLRENLSDSMAHSDWVRQPLDPFVARLHQQENLRPNLEAPPEQWLRRVTFDLTGFPPTPPQRDLFTQRLRECGDDREGVYARTVDEFLSSFSFGERWAAVWMDLARYADSMGYEKDPHRDAWPYRDWLVDAFNADMPYDEFTIAQLAGDLWHRQQPDKIDADVLIATAFHRNTMTNTEGGTDDEEYRVAAVIDRVNTTWTVWQGFTFGCVQCHSHPYDAVDHQEYYSVMALFNDSLDSDLPSDFPTLTVPNDSSRTNAISTQLDWFDQRQRRNKHGSTIAATSAWQTLSPEHVSSTEGSLAITEDEIHTSGGTFPVGVHYTLDFIPSESSITAIRLHFLPTSDDPADWPEQGSVVSAFKARVVGHDGVGKVVYIPSAVFVDKLTEPDDPMEASRASSSGVGPYPKMHGPRWAVFAFDSPIEFNGNDRLRLELRQAQETSGANSTPLRRFRCQSTSDGGWCDLLNSESFRADVDAVAVLSNSIKAIDGGTLPVMRSPPLSGHRQTRMFVRGNWLEKDDVVSPGVPKLFSESGQPPLVRDRLALARWLVSDDNPLTARVWANRVWEQLFGLGLVETLEDFGSSGVMPSNMELLDHLASRLKRHHQWRLKPLLREMVLSATYRQDHCAEPSRYEADRFNRSLTRGPRTRLSGEMVRDQALVVSGLLSSVVGGPPVKPTQPDGVWQTVYNGDQWATSEGEHKYRRAIYTYWKRTSPYPSALTFDVPTRENCSARRIVTNTPLQALVTLNDPVFVECGRELANRAMEQCGAAEDDPDAISELVLITMAESTTGAVATDNDVAVLRALYESLRDESAIGIDADAMAIIGNLLLNWDRALTK